MGWDKAAHGTALLFLLCTKEKKNNAGKRRRPCCYMEKPAVLNRANLQILLNPIFDDLKDNAQVLIFKENDKYNCIILSCDVQQKEKLDSEWSKDNKVTDDDYIICGKDAMRQAEFLKRKTKWNLFNYKLDKMYIMDAMNDWSNQFMSSNFLGEYFLAVTKSTN
eukprot:339776_1